MDWQSLTGTEKYQAYLASREWGLLREAVHQRAHGTCERCYKGKGNAVHHLTYARIYCERLEDLALLCDGCHDYTHGRSHKDPEEILVYMAGQVVNACDKGDEDTANDDTVDTWREFVFPSTHGRQSNGNTSNGPGRQFRYAGPTIDGWGHQYCDGTLHSGGCNHAF